MYICEIKNEEFDNYIYLNGGWIQYEKCPCCGMRKKSDGSNHHEFHENHYEVDEYDYGFTYDIEEMDKRLKGEFIEVPKELKTVEEIVEWMMNIKVETEDKDNNK